MQLRVTIGYQVDFPPFMADDGGPVGLLIDELTRRLGTLDPDIIWVGLDLAEQIPARMDGRLDVLAGLGVTPERAERLTFGPPVLQTGGALFRLADDDDRVRRIATPASGPLTGATRTSFPDAEVVEVADYPEALAAVADGEVDAAALNVHVGAQIAERQHGGLFGPPSSPFAPVDLAPAYRPGLSADGRRAIADALGLPPGT